MLFAFLVIKPSYTILNVSIVQSPLGLSESVAPGETLLFTWPKSVAQFYLDHKILNRIRKNSALGVVSHRIGKSSYLVGEYPLVAGHAFRSPQLKVFIHQMQVNHIVKIAPSSLRLPSSVIKKLEDYDDETRAKDIETMTNILSQTHGEMTSECWQRPLHSKIVSKFASPRFLPSGQQYYHSGLDLRARTGTPIPTTASGTIAYADHMVVSGNMVIVDHGGGVFSRYLHLSKINVSVNEKVKQGQIIGLSGATGRVEAPHLHWEVLWKGTHADPLRFLSALDTTCDQG